MKPLVFDNIILGGGIVGTWVAKRLLQKGKKVAVIEIGPYKSQNDDELTPPIHFTEREHLGATKARNHVLTGNSRFWGGALIGNDKEILADIISSGDDTGKNLAKTISGYYQNVADALNIPLTKKEKFIRGNVELTISEVLVLTGRKRDIWSKFYNNQPNLHLFCNAEIVSVTITGNSITEILIKLNDGEQVLLVSKEFLLSMGVIDSIIFIKRHLKSYLGEKAIRSGTHLHDHWSVPIADFKWDKNSKLNLIFPPKFNKGQIVGRRINLGENEKIKYNGFIHVQASYDTTPLYSVLKEIVFARQKKLPISELVKESLKMLPHTPTIFALAYDRFIKQRLYLPNGTELTIVLDFESEPDAGNRIELQNEIPDFFWNLRDKDYANFADLFDRGKKLLNDVLNSDEICFREELLLNPDEYLVKNAIDAYHLGGGLTMGNNPDKFIDLNLRFYDIKNLALVSTAMFNRPGIANPVYTLLSFAEYYINSLN